MIHVNVFERYPLLPIALSLIVGIMAGRFMLHSVSSVAWLVMSASCLLVCFFLWRFRNVQTVLLLSSFFLLGATVSNRAELQKTVALPDTVKQYKAVVASELTERGKTIRFDAQITDGPLSGRMIKVSLLKDTIGKRYSSITVNDGIVFHAKLERPANYYDSKFNYADYLLNHGYVAQAFIYADKWCLAQLSLQQLSLCDRARLKVMRYRHNLLENLHAQGLQGQAHAIVSAMVLGSTTMLTSDMRDAYSQTGVSHVLSLSGLHLAIIYTLLSFVSFRRKFKSLSSIMLICSIWAYAFLVGMMPSVVRSALMLSVMSIVSLTGRNPMSLNVLSFAAIAMLLANPLSLYDIGFQLSFLAVGFIVAFHQCFNAIVPIAYQMNHPVVRWCWQMVLVSSLAQAGTMPLVVYYFGNIPLLSLFANFVAIPCTTAILYLGVAMLFLGFIPFVGKAIAMVLTYIVVALNTFLSSLVALPFSSINNININMYQMIISYLIIFCIIILLSVVARNSSNHNE